VEPDSEDASATEVEDADQSPEQVIESSDDLDDAGDAGQDPSGSSIGDDEGDPVQIIEPTDPENVTTTEPDDLDESLESTEVSPVQTIDTRSGPSLGSAEVYMALSDVPGDGARLGLNADGQLIFSDNPGRVSLENNGISLEVGSGQTGQVVLACVQGDQCIDVSSVSGAGGSYTDTPLGWLNGEVIYERDGGETIEFRAITLDSATLAPVADRPLGGGDASLKTVTWPYPVSGGLLVPSLSSWIFISPSSVQVVDGNPYGQDLAQIRFNSTTGQVSYVSGGFLLLASISAPGSPIGQVAFFGADYDISPDGSRIAVSTGATIEIWDTQGNIQTAFANNEGVSLGSLTWLNDGLVYVDSTNGVLRVVQP
jgi:hypothetical protein